MRSRTTSEGRKKRHTETEERLLGEEKTFSRITLKEKSHTRKECAQTPTESKTRKESKGVEGLLSGADAHKMGGVKRNLPLK